MSNKAVKEIKENTLIVKRTKRVKKEIIVKSSFTEDELKHYYLLQCPDVMCNWKGLSRDVIDVEETDDETIIYICPHCGEPLEIVK
jgi:hypothetical protein